MNSKRTWNQLYLTRLHKLKEAEAIKKNVLFRNVKVTTLMKLKASLQADGLGKCYSQEKLLQWAEGIDIRKKMNKLLAEVRK